MRMYFIVKIMRCCQMRAAAAAQATQPCFHIMADSDSVCLQASTTTQSAGSHSRNKSLSRGLVSNYDVPQV
jgi:hypothetical protein|eukprot:COSAG01_NODE_3986_length_5464_cov_13.193780_2_plen_71_part_00